MLINLTPHPIRIYPYGTPDRFSLGDIEPEMVLEPAEQPARIGENYLFTQTLPYRPARVAHVEFRHTTGLPPWDGDPLNIQTWYVVSLPLALSQAGKRPDLLAPHLEVRDLDGTVIGCRELVLPV